MCYVTAIIRLSLYSMTMQVIYFLFLLESLVHSCSILKESFATAGARGMGSVANYINAHKQTQLNQVCIVVSLVHSLLPEDLISEFISFNKLFFFTEFRL